MFLIVLSLAGRKPLRLCLVQGTTQNHKSDLFMELFKHERKSLNYWFILRLEFYKLKKPVMRINVEDEAEKRSTSALVDWISSTLRCRGGSVLLIGWNDFDCSNPKPKWQVGVFLQFLNWYQLKNVFLQTSWRKKKSFYKCFIVLGLWELSHVTLVGFCQIQSLCSIRAVVWLSSVFLSAWWQNERRLLRSGKWTHDLKLFYLPTYKSFGSHLIQMNVLIPSFIQQLIAQIV